MPIYKKPSSSFQKPLEPWWVRISRTLWKPLAYLWTAVLLSVVVNVVSILISTSEYSFPRNSPVTWLLVHWPIPILIVVAFFLLTTFTWIVARQSSQDVTPTSISHQIRNKMLLHISHDYQRMLDQSLHNTVFIDPDIAQMSSAVQNPFALLLRQFDPMERPYPPGTSLMQVYDVANGELLILGEPGAGKSTMLLQLAQELARRAAQDEMQPLPIILHLSSWGHCIISGFLYAKLSSSFSG